MKRTPVPPLRNGAAATKPGIVLAGTEDAGERAELRLGVALEPPFSVDVEELVPAFWPVGSCVESAGRM